MTPRTPTLSVMPGRLAICRLEPGAEFPEWALTADFLSVTRTADELSVVCPEERVPAGVKGEGGRIRLKVEGPLALSTTGILSSITAPLARAGIGVFAVSTYDTDHLLVREADLERAISVLTEEGHRVER